MKFILCGSLYDDKLLFAHAVQYPVNMFPALTLAAQLVRVEKFIYGNIKKGDESAEWLIQRYNRQEI